MWKAAERPANPHRAICNQIRTGRDLPAACHDDRRGAGRWLTRLVPEPEAASPMRRHPPSLLRMSLKPETGNTMAAYADLAIPFPAGFREGAILGGLNAMLQTLILPLLALLALLPRGAGAASPSFSLDPAAPGDYVHFGQVAL